MATTEKTLNGFELKTFALDRLYSPQEQREIKAGNSAYYAEVNRVKRLKEFAEQEAKKPRVLSPDERYALAVQEDNKRKAEHQAREDFQANLLKQHEQYLQSDIERATICCNSLLIFLQEYTHWISRKYTLEIETLDCQPSLFVAYMIAPEAPAKTSKK
jgi:hypothetical protein